MKKSNKGFTLIELLTVIAILAIVLLIAAPTILGVLDKARKNTFKNQVLLYVEALKTEAVLSSIGVSEMNLKLPNVGETKTIDIKTITMESETKLEGKILIYSEEKGQYTYKLLGVNDGNYCIGDNGEAVNVDIITTGDNNSIIHKYSSTCTDVSKEPEVSYTPYSIGDEVTLINGSTWYVIEDSNETSDTVTLLSKYNFKNDGSGWSEMEAVIDNDYKIAFDSDNSNTYDESDIKEFIEGTVLEIINDGLTNEIAKTGIRLITTDDICRIINSVDASNSCNITSTVKLIELYKSVPEWLYATYYWTMSANLSNESQLFHINPDGVIYDYVDASNSTRGGARPVITTSKLNIIE